MRSSRIRLELIEPQRPLVKSPVSCHGHGEDLVDGNRVGFESHVVVVLKDFLHEVVAEVFAGVESYHVHSHFGRCDHFHGFGDLANAVDGFHAEFDGLFVGGEGVGGSGGQADTLAVERTEHL